MESDVPFAAFDVSSSLPFADVDEVPTLGDDVPEACCLDLVAGAGSDSLSALTVVFSAARGTSGSAVTVSEPDCGLELVVSSSGVGDVLLASVEGAFAVCGVTGKPLAAWAYENVGISGLALIAAMFF